MTVAICAKQCAIYWPRSSTEADLTLKLVHMLRNSLQKVRQDLLS